MYIVRFFLLLYFFLLFQNSWAQNASSNFGNLKVFGSHISFFGDFTNEGAFTENGGFVEFNGSSLQSINGTAEIECYNFTLNNSSNIQLDNQLKVNNNLGFSNGMILTDRSDFATEFVHFTDTATYSGVNDTKHIDGVVRKTGSIAFSFPVGDENHIQPIIMSSPSQITDAYTSYYLNEDPNSIYPTDSLGTACYTAGSVISNCEYWRLERTNGNSNIEVELTWDSNSCGVTAPCELLVSRWGGSNWLSEGNGGVSIISGPSAEGTVKTGTGCGSCGANTTTSGFGYFTLSSFTPNNPLPIELLNFDAYPLLDIMQVGIDWQTASETNNDYFIIEKSENGFVWSDIDTVSGAGNSNSLIEYSIIDPRPIPGISYYRLKQFDFNGTVTFSDIKSVLFDMPFGKNTYILYPNPTRDLAFLRSEKSINSYSISDATGKLIYQSQNQLLKNNITLNLIQFPPGIYFVSFIDEQNQIQKVKLSKIN